jgi:dihydrofolate reductase
MITLYNAVSSDGFIARKDGSEDFIPNVVWDDFIELSHLFDVLVMGKNTYQTLQHYEPEELERFEHLPIKKVVISREPDIELKKGYTLAHTVTDVPKLGKNILLSSGPSLNTAFLKEKLIDIIILNIVPTNIDTGIREFNGMTPELTLKQREERIGRTLCTYDVLK